MRRFLSLFVCSFLFSALPLAAQGAFLGVSLDAAPEGKGAAVAQVHEKTCASLMGLQPGDLILAAGEEPVAAPQDLVSLLQRSRPGDWIELTVRREGRVQRLQGILGRRPGEAAGRPSVPSAGFLSSDPEMERFLANLPEEEAERIRSLLEEGRRIRIQAVPGAAAPIPPGEEAEAPAPEGPLGPALREARATGRPLLLDFHASWCGPCRQLEAEVLDNPSFQDLLARFVVVRIDVEEHPELASEYGVAGIPDLRVLTPEGEPAEHWVGYAGVEATVARLREAAEKHRRRPGGPERAEGGPAERAAREARLRARIEELRAEIEALRAEIEALRSRP